MARAAGTGNGANLDDRATTDVVRSLVDNSQLLIKKELELAKLEVKEIVTEKVMGAAFAAIAGILGLYLLGFLGVAGAKALELVVAPWLAWLIVSGVVLLIIVVLLAVAFAKFKKPASPERTKDDVQTTVDWAKTQVTKDRTGGRA